jgi:ATP-dependent DNA helicase RecG
VLTQQRQGTREHPARLPRLTLDSPLTDVRLLQRTPHAKFASLGIRALRDLIRHFPHRHVDYSTAKKIAELEEGMEATVIATVRSGEKLQIGAPPGAARVVLSDGTGLLTATWFRQSYLVDRFTPGTKLALSGRVYSFRGQAKLDSPEYEVLPSGGVKELTHAGNLLPVYHSTEGLPQRTIRTAVRRALDIALPLLQDPVPAGITRRHGMPALARAVEDMHFPASARQRDEARRRLAFDELFLNQVAVIQRRAAWRGRGDGVPVPGGSSLVVPFLQAIEYELTADQKHALDTVLSEMAQDVPMGRLLQGEVGSGKTVVALAALLAAALARRQGALMAPTEVLAEQHFIAASRQLQASPVAGLPEVVRETGLPGLRSQVRIALLTGSLTARTKASVQSLVRRGGVQLVIGTHALLQEPVDLPGLALAVVDEQHRFGVEQRAALVSRRPRPHLLAMSATPIPRTLSLTVYGDLDLSTLKELPRGRQPIETRWARTVEDRVAAYELVRTEVAEGRQAFVVCPLIEPSEEMQARDAVTEFIRLQTDELAGLRVGLLHGRLSLAEKQGVMDRMRAGAIDVLVATPVIEVGVDVPNATVMLVESADRFGLAQLHQFRGRVGRGQHKSYCVLLSNDPGDEARERLSVVARVSDGFELAEEDLRIRGPGDYVGTRQSGWAELKVATLSDVELLTIARREAQDLLEADPHLDRAEHRLLAEEVLRVTAGRPAELS